MRAVTVLALFCFAVETRHAFGQSRNNMPATLFSWDGNPEPPGELDPISTDRPDFTEASSTVGLNVVQLEMGYTFSAVGESESHSWGEPLLRIGMFANWLEFRAGVSPVTDIAMFGTSGTEDLYLGAKLGLTQQEGWLPELALMPQMTVPTGSTAFTADRVLPGANCLYGWDIGEHWSMGGSTQFNRAVGDNGLAYDEWAQSMTVGMSLGEDLAAYLEWFAIIPSQSVDTSPGHYVNGGITYLVTDDAQLDLRIGKGLSDASDDYFAGAGLSLRFQ